MASLSVKSPAVGFHAGRSVDQIVASIPEQNVGRKIRALRRAAGMSLRDISETVGVSFVQFHRYETGVSLLSTVRLLSISKALGVPAGLLLSEPEATKLDHLAERQGGDTRELFQLFESLSDESGRRAVLLFARAAVARQELLREHERSLSSGQPDGLALVDRADAP